MEQLRDDRQRGQTVRVVYGVHEMELDLAGATLAQAREVARAALNVPEEAATIVEGEKAEEDRVLRADETLEFIQEAGKKG